MKISLKIFGRLKKSHFICTRFGRLDAERKKVLKKVDKNLQVKKSYLSLQSFLKSKQKIVL
jgi:hypothetical protein